MQSRLRCSTFEEGPEERQFFDGVCNRRVQALIYMIWGVHFQWQMFANTRVLP